MFRLFFVVGLFLLVGCQKPADSRFSRYSDERVVAHLTRPPASNDKAADAAAGADASAKPHADIASSDGPQLAYAYDFGIAAPQGRLHALLLTDQQRCEGAGYQVCQVVGSDLQDLGSRDMTAALSLRATPAWVRHYRAQLDSEARQSGGRVAHITVTSEDLTAQMTDLEARLKAETTLRDRLQAILASRPGKTADLIETETALSKVQGDLDASRSTFAVMRGRVALSEVTIKYEAAEGRRAANPLLGAIASFGDNLLIGAGFLVNAIAVLAPALAVLVLLWWLRRPLARFLPRLGRRKRQPPTG